MKKKILIVEDDKDISMIEEIYLQSSGFETKIISDGDLVKPEIEKNYYDLILLDIMLPNKDGYDICQEIREIVKVPILMVTARTESIDKIKGFQKGADDYISKPFDPMELVARVQANIRQFERNSTSNLDIIKVHNIEIYSQSHKVFKNGKEIKLANKEYELFYFLSLHSNIVFTKEQLFEKIWGYDYISDSATVMVHINRIRDKIEDDNKSPKILETIWGVGYRLNG